MLRKIFPKINNVSLVSNLSTNASDLIVKENVVQAGNWLFPPKYQKPRQAWIENLDTIDAKKIGLMELHPSIFGANPRIDLLHRNVQWQKMYRFVSYAHTKLRFEVKGGGRKPWPQKG